MAGMVYDSRNVALWLHGGGWTSDGQCYGDLMRLDLQSFEWSEALLSGTTEPSVRRAHAMVYDSSSHVVWLHGGYNDKTVSFLQDLWQLELASMTWHQVYATGPAGREGAQMVHDSFSNALWLHGGAVGYSYPGEVWKLELDVMQWRSLDLDQWPSGRKFHQMVFDTARDVLYVHGGENLASSQLDDLWKLDRISTTTSSSVTTSSSTRTSTTLSSTTLSSISTTATKTEERLSASTMWGFLFISSGVWTLLAFAAYLVVTAGVCCLRFLWRLQDARIPTHVPGQTYQSYGLRHSTVDDNSEPAQAEDAEAQANSGLANHLHMPTVQHWKNHPWFLAICMLFESVNLVSSALYVVEAHQRAVLTEFYATCSDGTTLVPILAAECRTEYAELNSMSNCASPVTLGDVCEADAFTFTASTAHCNGFYELQNCGAFDVYRRTSTCHCPTLAHALWVCAGVSFACTIIWTCRFYTNRLGLDTARFRRPHVMIYALLACVLCLITFLGLLGRGVAVVLIALMCPVLAWLLWLFVLVLVIAREDDQAQGPEEVDFHILRQSAALELPMFNVLVALMLEETDIQKLNELRAPLHQGLRLLEDMPECIIGAIDLYYFGGSWFTALGISMSLLMITLQLVVAMSAKVLAKARQIARRPKRPVATE